MRLSESIYFTTVLFIAEFFMIFTLSLHVLHLFESVEAFVLKNEWFCRAFTVRSRLIC